MEALRAMIRDRLHGSPLVAQALEARPDLKDDPAALLAHLEERGLVDDIFSSLESSLQQQRGRAPPPLPSAAAAAEPAVPTRPAAACPLPTPSQAWAAAAQPATQPVASGGAAAAAGGAEAWLAGGPGGGASWQLCLRVSGGRAFLDYLDEGDTSGKELQLHLSFGRDRCRGRPVRACTEPAFDESFFLRLPGLPSRAALLLHDAPLHLVLVACDAPGATEDPWDAGHSTLICSHFLEWRHCLAAAGPAKSTVELKGVGRRHQLSVGILHVELELRPAGSAAALLPELAVCAQLREEEQRRAAVMRRAFEGLDRWWAEHHGLYLDRAIRFFAQTESSLFLPLTSFVAPLEAGRALDSPAHALRWVALLPSEPGPAREASLGASSTEPRWHTFPALFARGRGSAEEKALLLCSLLLGYSLDAWCCLGSDARGQPHAWVAVRERGDASRPAEVTCWDPRAGARVSADQAQYLSSYGSIDALFNDRGLFICHAAGAGAAAKASFDLSDPRLWLRVPVEDEALEALRLYPPTRRGGETARGGGVGSFASLRPRQWALALELERMEEAIEGRIAGAVRAHREASRLPTRFDEHLSELLHVALANCELERTGGQPQAQLFEAMVRRACPDHEVFHAVPVQFNHLKVSLYWPSLSERPTVQDMLATQTAATFAVRARVVPYPEGAVAAWVLLAARVRG